MTTTWDAIEPSVFVDVGGAEVPVRRFGDGPDVLFVHGWPVSGATFRHLVPHLATRVTCHVIDLPGAGSSRFDAGSDLSITGHVHAVGRVVDALGLRSFAAVGHDSGGLVARFAFAGDARLRAMGLIDTEQPHGPSWRFRSFTAARHLPGFAALLRWSLGRPAVRRHPLLLGDAFADRSLLEGEFDELFLEPIRRDPARLAAAVSVLRSFDLDHFAALEALHRRIDVPVQLVWGADDPFFPLGWAEEMVGTFADASLAVIEGTKLFSHEERPEEVAAALLAVLDPGYVRTT